MIVTVPTLQARNAPLASASEQLRVLDALPLAGGDFDARLAAADLGPLTAQGIEVFQVNVGKLCNQTCHHCHVDAGPTRTEQMSAATAELALAVLAATSIPTVDITGGAPELSPVFRRLVEGARALGRHVIDRCNLTVLALPRCDDLPRFLAANQVEVVASLPHYRQAATDRQRGDGVFERSLAGLRRLNEVGYGRGDLRLVLVTNPVGAFLPGASQATLEAEWKREMRRLHGIEFDALYTITNLPIARFLEWLEQSGNLAGYMERLTAAFNPTAASGVMCRTTISVGWDGRLFDCDFNQMLELETAPGLPRHLADFDLAALATRRIVTRRHCFGCTAGAGSSCGGQTAS